MGQNIKLKRALAAPLISHWRERVLKPQMIDMSANPYDLRPLAYAITNRIEALRELKPDEPVIVPLGEDHTIIQTQMLQQAVMQACLNRGLIPAFTVEEKHNMFAMLSDITEMELDDDAKKLLLDHDPHNRILSKLLLFCSVDQKDTQQWKFCDERHISIGFNDAARFSLEDDTSILDYTDDVTRRNAKKLGYPTSLDDIDERDTDTLSDDDVAVIEHKGHKFLSATGFHIRNNIMVEKTLEQYKAQTPDVMIMKTGSIHVFGLNHPLQHLPHEESLSHIFRKHTKALLPFSPIFNQLPISREADMTHAIFAKGMGEDSTRFIGTHILHIAEESGGLIEAYPPLMTKDREVYANQILDEVHAAVERSVAANAPRP